ncbi:hypothetical protein D3C87_1974170 [compost metagenome]
MEARKLARLVDEVERRKIHRRQESQAREAGQVRLGNTLARIEQIGQIPGLGGERDRDQIDAESQQSVDFHGQGPARLLDVAARPAWPRMIHG